MPGGFDTLYKVGFFTLMAYAPFVMGLERKGWGTLLALTSVFMAPKLQKWFGTIKAMVIMLILFALDLVVMEIFPSSQWVVISAVIFAGAVLEISNTIIITAVMEAAPVDRSTISAAYSFLRFLGAAITTFITAKLGEVLNPHVPFMVGAVFVLLSVLFVWLNYKPIKLVNSVSSAH